MTAQLAALCFDARDPARLAHFWSEVLGWEVESEPGPAGFRIRFVPSTREKTRQNQMHFDLTSTSAEDQRRTVARALELGGRHVDVGQGPDATHVVLGDPEGNEFCVIAPGNKFLADCGFLGAVACDGSQEVGYFWSRALGWPLVWDQDQETAIRSPHGGPKITWGGPPVPAKPDRNRLWLDLVVADDADQSAEIERLVSLGARFAESEKSADSAGRSGPVAMTDPDGNEFFVGLSS